MKIQHDECGREDGAPSLRERLIQAIVQPVPDGLALCEFSCSKTECSAEEWKHCKRRLDALKLEEN
jgi:hypothetical protein